MNDAQLINQNSGIVEYYTPETIVISARLVMGRIDLDPASSGEANSRVKASRIFTRYNSGISQPWCKENGAPSKVWMNHPFGRAEAACPAGCTKKHAHHDFPYHGNAAWINKLESEFDCGNVAEACSIAYACTSEKWFLPLLKRPQCFLSPRTNYLLPDGTVFKGVTKGSVVTYYGQNVKAFADEFKMHGVVKIPWQL
jgi:hypothetical protein